MNRKALLLVGFSVLGILMMLGVLDVCDCAKLSAGKVLAAGEANKPPAEDFKVVTYYFHGTYRCPTCRKIEAYSHEAVQTSFGDALKTGRLEWRALNVEEPANQHFIKDYKLYTRSLVLVSYQGEKQLKWKNLEKVWELVRDKEQFTRYVQDEVRAFMESR